MITEVYIDTRYPGKIIKEYIAEGRNLESLDELIDFRKKMVAEKNWPDWPKFFIRPEKVSQIKRTSFKTLQQFVEGEILYDYIRNNGIDIRTCARLIRNIEKDVMAAEKFVFPDIANGGNIIVQKKNGEITYRAIDSDDVAFDDYYCTGFSRKMSGELLANGKYALGVNKCFEDDKGEYLYPNKQLDIRSIYALLYLIMDSKRNFYPHDSNEKMQKYMYYLDRLNIPQGSDLYKKFLITLSEDEPSQIIGDSLYELIDDGYSFKERKKDGSRTYTLHKNKKAFFNNFTL